MTEKIKLKLDNIVAKHKSLFLASETKDEGLLTMKNNIERAPLASDKLNEELIDVCNEYLSENNIDDTTEFEHYIKTQLQGFYKFCLKGQ